jgi:AcrR family transcriptional regulator
VSGAGPGQRRRRAGSGTRGRPRDPATEERALRAALEIFGQKGLSGLTIDEVAARSKVGKSSIYLRWPDKDTLLAAALHSIQVEEPEEGGDAAGEPVGPAPATSPVEAAASADDDGAEAPTELTLRDYLVAHVHRRAELYLGEYGLAMLRLYAEARAHPELFGEIREQAISRFVLDERQRVAEAIRAGVLPAGASPVRILDAVEGAIFMHLLVTPPQLLPRVRASLDDYVENMVDDQLRAAGYDEEADLRRAAQVREDATPAQL